MTRTNHRHTAAALRQQAAAEAWEPWKLTQAIRAQCDTSLLQAWRLAQGWTLQEAVYAYAQVGGHATVQQLSAWETGRTGYGDTNLDLLCRLYRTRPDRLGHGRDYTPTTDSEPPPMSAPARPEPDPESQQRRAILRTLFAGVGVTLGSPVLNALAEVRRDMDDILSDTMSNTRLDQWERSAAEYGYAYQITPPSQLLGESVLDFVEVQQLLQRRQPSDHRLRLCRVAAQLAATAGMALVALGEHREARRWYRTAQLAADETGDRATRAWLLAREAVIPFYFGSPLAAAQLTERARMVAGNTPCATAAWAPALEARSLARLGRRDDALAAMRIAETAFARLPADQISDTGYGYTARQLRWHIGSMYTVLGDTRRAQIALDEALTLYAPTEHLDRALIAMDQAAGLVLVGEAATACQVTTYSLATLPTEHRTGIVLSRARDVLSAVPTGAGRLPAVRDLYELLASERKALPA
jgi:tetratricopeptide (TPR) repeat protein